MKKILSDLAVKDGPLRQYSDIGVASCILLRPGNERVSAMFDGSLVRFSFGVRSDQRVGNDASDQSRNT